MVAKFIIYCLHLDASDRVYVGRSSSGLKRPRSHRMLSSMKANARLPVTKWIEKWMAQGQLYAVAVLEECACQKDLNEAEAFHIAYFRSIGVSVLNCTAGGDGLLSPSVETRARLSAALKGKKRTPEQRAAMSKVMRSRPREMQRAAIEGLRRANKNQSVATRAKISAAVVRRYTSVEERERTAAALRGRQTSAETRAKLSAANRGKKRTPEMVKAMVARVSNPSLETRARLSAAHLGKKWTPEMLRKRTATCAANVLQRQLQLVPRFRINLGGSV